MKCNSKEVLLLTGLGDDKTVSRQLKYISWLNKCRPDNAQIHAFPTFWQTEETYEDKWARLVGYVNQHTGIEVVYGISAGASLAMSLISVLPKAEYHFISGKLRFPESIGPERQSRAPALYDSVVASEAVISVTDFSEHKMTCHVGYLDGVLTQKDMRVPGVPVERIPMFNHSATIAVAYATLLRKM